ncbi:ornithine cyclodeaminase family protein [Mycobacterium decipiens]|uniref:Ornithine cyclodeaminase n=1 Tax=Mycobacterium decipiens TaxID=1430326 RepID=A0A1X2LUL8_9MYCO|nr:ornithine cyclodeaminase family protein [Mycobacterium decipiens]OSC40645.1 ornithine cyclodeaminase [Mycobacterium decipiens]
MTTTRSVDFISAQAVSAALTPARAVQAIEDALRAGLDPAGDFQRTVLDVAHGQLLVMPSQSSSSVGVKVATVAPANPGRDLPLVQAIYILFDGNTLSPRVFIDGAALTTLRTPAVSIAAVKPALLRASTPLHVTVFGAGPQGVAHVDTIADVVGQTRQIASTTYVVRHPDIARLPPQAHVVHAQSPEAISAVERADVIVCATGSAVPVFDSRVAKRDVIVMAVGSHRPDRREVDSALCARAQVIVEDPQTALREGGDVVLAIAESGLTAGQLIPMKDVVTGTSPLHADRAVFFKSTGMGWEDAVVAEAIVSGTLDAT